MLGAQAIRLCNVKVMMSRKFERPVTAQAAVLTELRQRIIRGEVLPGQAIRQELLASELGVSRLPVREALVVLQSERLVEYTQHKGYVVAVLDEDDLVQTYQLREVLENVAIDQAVEKLGDDAIRSMEEILAEMESDPGTKAERIQRNRRFHFALFNASRNMRLISLLSQLWDTCDRYRALYYPETSALDRVQSGHQDIIKAAADRDSARLKELLTERRGWAFTEALRVVHSANEQAISEQTAAL
ncbi:GntR family transcriptional regulator [soil metagenome]